MFMNHEINRTPTVVKAAYHHLLLTYSSLEHAMSQRLVQSRACSEQIELFRRMPSQYWAAVITGPLIPPLPTPAINAVLHEVFMSIGNED